MRQFLSRRKQFRDVRQARWPSRASTSRHGEVPCQSMPPLSISPATSQRFRRRMAILTARSANRDELLRIVRCTSDRYDRQAIHESRILVIRKTTLRPKRGDRHGFSGLFPTKEKEHSDCPCAPSVGRDQSGPYDLLATLVTLRLVPIGAGKSATPLPGADKGRHGEPAPTGSLSGSISVRLEALSLLPYSQYHSRYSRVRDH